MKLTVINVATRPIKLVRGFKKIEAAILRGYCNPKPDKGFGFLVFGSINGRDFQLIAGLEPMGESYDIELYKTAFSVREIVVLPEVVVDVDPFFTYFAFTHPQKYGNKLR